MSHRRDKTPSGPRLWLRLLTMQLAAGYSGPGLTSAFETFETPQTRLDDGIPDFVTKYAPLVWLHSDDPYRPSDLLEHVRHTKPMVAQKPVPDIPELNLENLAFLNSADGDTPALSMENITSTPSWLKGQLPNDKGIIDNATACVVILIEKDSEVSDVHYWYFYSYNLGPNITQVLDPLDQIFGDDPPDYHFGDHVGDWEHNMIRFMNGKPSGIFYSQHDAGKSFSWDDEVISKKDERPVVYSALGTHANYPSEGNQIRDTVLIDLCEAGHMWDPVKSAYFYKFDIESSEFTPISSPGSNKSTPSGAEFFLYFDGRWGNEKLLDNDPHQDSVPYFGLKRFIRGPPGPLQQDLVRKGLAPDNPRPRSWAQWMVGVFMWWYPCCIKGWRKWMSLVLFISFWVLAGFGIRYIIKKKQQSKGKKYMKLETEVPLEDLAVATDSRSNKID